MNIEKWIIEADISSTQLAMESGDVRSEDIVRAYLERINKYNRKINAVLEINPEAIEIAINLDKERQEKGSRGLLHGIPILLKDNIDTHDKMHTSAGSIALKDSIAPGDSVVASKLRAAGAVLLGKANMTEWANFMSNEMWAGYSSRGGLVLNPYGPGELFVGGSSSGPAVAVAANFAAAAVGTETSGSIISPASQNNIVGIKPTLGLISQAGIIPLAHSQDSAGPMTKTVKDTVILLSTLIEENEQSPHFSCTQTVKKCFDNYDELLDVEFLKQARIGIARYYYQDLDEARANIVEEAIQVLKKAGATIIDPVSMPCEKAQWDWDVLRYEFKSDLNAYLARLSEDVPVRSLEEVIAYNEKYAEEALKYGQGTLIWSNETSGTLKEKEYIDSLNKSIELSRKQGIDHALNSYELDALMFLGDEGSDLAARAGYPIITVPGGYASSGIIAPGGYTTKGPQGITFVGTAYSEPTLIKIAYGFEQATKHRVPPKME
ncbi:amidase [Paenibacillus turicensis]|uniref:Amidase n=1 Tax=Paenibacillus turicensis TaxID=160487 RepID=A0ABS4FVE4_9BACL|nr:amidase family protein [Paenibacillus turicensis]MBP1906490.1 amidase [Paenibacillus turicensis]